MVGSTRSDQQQKRLKFHAAEKAGLSLHADSDHNQNDSAEHKRALRLSREGGSSRK